MFNFKLKSNLSQTALHPRTQWWLVDTLRPRQNGHHFPDEIIKLIFLNENIWISINISLKFVSRGPISNIPTLVQVMAWRLPGDKPLSEPMMVRLPTHICVTRPQWVNINSGQWLGAVRQKPFITCANVDHIYVTKWRRSTDFLSYTLLYHDSYTCTVVRINL